MVAAGPSFGLLPSLCAGFWPPSRSVSPRPLGRCPLPASPGCPLGPWWRWLLPSCSLAGFPLPRFRGPAVRAAPRRPWCPDWTCP
eukprot:10507894-Alexandrium_andersonii.AAC.1